MANKELWTEYNGKGFGAEYADYAVRATKDEDGNVIADTYATKDAMTGATASTAGTAGLVPAPAAGDQGKVLAGDGNWSEVEEYTNAYIDSLPWLTGPSVVIGGREYPVVQIGNQLWLAENLKYDGVDHILNSDGEYFYHIGASLGDVLPEGWRIPYAPDIDTLVNNLNPNGVNKCSAVDTGYSAWDRYAIGGSGLNFYPYGYNTNGEQGFRSVGAWACYVGRDRFGSAQLIYINSANSWNYMNYNNTEKGNIRLVKDLT